MMLIDHDFAMVDEAVTPRGEPGSPGDEPPGDSAPRIVLPGRGRGPLGWPLAMAVLALAVASLLPSRPEKSATHAPDPSRVTPSRIDPTAALPRAVAIPPALPDPSREAWEAIRREVRKKRAELADLERLRQQADALDGPPVRRGEILEVVGGAPGARRDRGLDPLRPRGEAPGQGRVRPVGVQPPPPVPARPNVADDAEVQQLRREVATLDAQNAVLRAELANLPATVPAYGYAPPGPFGYGGFGFGGGFGYGGFGYGGGFGGGGQGVDYIGFGRSFQDQLFFESLQINSGHTPITPSYFLYY